MQRHRIDVIVVSPEEADHGVAEFWVDGELLGQTLLRDEEMVLSIDPRSDGGPWALEARSLHDALARARTLLGGR